jgi:hypothetical protein
MAEMPKAEGARKEGVGRAGHNAGYSETRVTLASQGIDKNLANRARKLAAMTEREFEDEFALAYFARRPCSMLDVL